MKTVYNFIFLFIISFWAAIKYRHTLQKLESLGYIFVVDSM